MSGEYRVRTEVLFAAASPVAVVLRRGPRTHWRLMAWDTSQDVFTPGQWMKGLVRLADLSPDGGKLMYWAGQFHGTSRLRQRSDGGQGPFDPAVRGRQHVLQRIRKRHPHRRVPRYLSGVAPGHPLARDIGSTWTAISTPPYFSALAIWPAVGHWSGGGYFAGPNSVVLYESADGMVPVEIATLPSTLTISGWNTHADAREPPVTLARSPLRQPLAQHDEIEQALKAGGVGFVDWSWVLDGGDLVFAADGVIWRHAGMPRTITRDLLDTSRALIDLRPMAFELMRAPDWAMRW